MRYGTPNAYILHKTMYKMHLLLLYTILLTYLLLLLLLYTILYYTINIVLSRM